tara:strand:+ start:890 stop:1198 length:309 start_codon:yes stop_codon:yes gene_type:complete
MIDFDEIIVFGFEDDAENKIVTKYLTPEQIKLGKDGDFADLQDSLSDTQKGQIGMAIIMHYILMVPKLKKRMLALEMKVAALDQISNNHDKDIANLQFKVGP